MTRAIATWNVNSLRVRLPHLTEWLAANPIDAIALQETKLPDADFPAAGLQALGWHCAFSGQRTYNGVAILSRDPVTDVVAGIPGFDDEQRRVLAVSLGSLRVIDVYVPNGQTVGSDKFAYKLRWFDALREYVAAELARHPQLVVLGDFNVAPEDRDVHDPKAWEGSVHVSPPERAALQALLGAGLADCFRLFEQPEKSYSWWDYRMMAFRRNAGLRIDLILASNALAQKCGACHIDKAPRKLERPSDHAPVVASFDI
ncbi:MAG: exodeoxyribonuclease III [Gammaproteobacteria bacterium]|nr:exodeoxyribonuclease III [Gammaproteobacteria bacterium]MDH4311372.1 exodeoxyribonuclease III [Gammaproteobacteria bacterium]MDH5272223.1 exodeoxyribonuclease III [Gammaproteobacteria bacterium]